MLSEFSSGHICDCYKGLEHFHLDGAYLQMQTHLVPKIMHQKQLDFLLQFYGQIGFIVLVPEKPTTEHVHVAACGCSRGSSSQSPLRLGKKWLNLNVLGHYIKIIFSIDTMHMQFAVCPARIGWSVAVIAAKRKQDYKGLTYPFLSVTKLHVLLLRCQHI